MQDASSLLFFTDEELLDIAGSKEDRKEMRQFKSKKNLLVRERLF
jgi:hypothetical protein